MVPALLAETQAFNKYRVGRGSHYGGQCESKIWFARGCDVDNRNRACGTQWLNVPTKGIPRTKEGKPDLTAPVPRKPDGKPDLSGIWANSSPNGKYALNLAVDFKLGDLPFQVWAGALTKERMTGVHASEWLPTNCLPPGIPWLDAVPIYPFKIIQEPDLIVALYEHFGAFRQIFLDGRELPKDPNPSWLGYSVGRWDGDALVIDTIGFSGKTWLDNAGHPTTDALHIIERFRPRDFGHLDLQLTIDDPKAYTKSWTVAESLELWADTELLEYVCYENEKDRQHLPGR